MKSKSNLISFIIFLPCMLFFSVNNHAANEKPSVHQTEYASQKTISSLPLPEHKPIQDPLFSNEQAPQKKASFSKLNDIINNIKQQKKEIEEKLNLLKKAKTEQERANIQSEIDDINQSIEEQEKSFEMIQTGGLELPTKSETTEAKQFDWKDWQKDLLEILQPIMSELRDLTEDRRKLEDLRNKISFHQSQINDINAALNHMAQIDKTGLDRNALEQFERINKKWQNRLKKNEHLLEVAQLQLDEMIKSQTAKEISIGNHIKQFATGRGTTLFLAVIAFIAVYSSLMLLWKGILWVSKLKKKGKPTIFQRVFTLIYYSTTVIFSLAAIFYILNIRNDQVLIGITVLLLIIVIWVLKNSIPRYIQELQILLNTGSVREGERILYNGIPMKVTNLNFYTKLTNPALPDLVHRLPLSELSEYISRPCLKDEPWFPCQEGDFVMLSDGTYNKVRRITLENVLLSAPNGIMPQTYTIHDFLAAKPKNFSRGFVVTSDFGIDYKYQQECTTRIPEILCAGIRQGLLQKTYGDSLKDIWVFFAQANTSSLDYIIVAIFDGLAAEDYYSITRDLQRYAVEVCNQQQWEIPYTQLVIHNAQN